MSTLATECYIVVVEGDHVFGPAEAEKMKLPFDYGWESWAVIQNDQVVVLTQHFEIADETCRALNNRKYVNETRH